MKKSILNLGKALNKTEQKQINGGVNPTGCAPGSPIYFQSGTCCVFPSPTTGQNCWGQIVNNYCNYGPRCFG